MPRPPLPRTVAARPIAPLFKPGGVPGVAQIRMALDEFEAIRLADMEHLLQAEAATRMGISRATFGRILASARRKVAEAIVLGRALRIEGGTASPSSPMRGRSPACARCAAAAACARCGQGLVHLARRRERG